MLFGEEPTPYIRQCANKCVFCFIKGYLNVSPPSAVCPMVFCSSLYIKDDDYRYSFLFG